MYLNQQPYRSNTTAANTSNSQASVPSQVGEVNVAAFVNSLINKNQSLEQQNKMQSAHEELERQLRANQLAAQNAKAFNVSHNQTFTINRHVEIRGSLNELQADPSKLTWKASDAPFELPFPNARAILLKSTIKQTQNTFPVTLAGFIEGVESSSKWTSNKVKSDFVLSPLMRQPIKTKWTQFERQNIENFDMSQLEGWNNVDEKSIEAEVLNTYKEGLQEYAELAYPSITVNLIQRILPDLTEKEIIYADRDGTGANVSVFVGKAIAENAQLMAKTLLKTTSFCDPNALVVRFQRVDGEAINSVNGLVDAAPGLNAFTKDSLADTVGHASVIIEQTFALYAPDA